MIQLSAPSYRTIRPGTAHGGMAAVTASAPVSVGAILRPTYGIIRVWTHNWRAPEDFTIAEARGLCARIDAAMGLPSLGDPDCGVWIDDGGAKLALVAPRQWFISFLAAVRREIRKADMRASVLTIDSESEPGSWARHLRHMAPITGAI